MPQSRIQMGQVPWTARFHGEMAELQRNLSPLAGFYLNVVIDQFVLRLGRLPADDKLLAFFGNSTARTWRKARDELVEKGHIHIVDDQLHCDLAHEQLNRALRQLEGAKKGGKASQAKQRGKRAEDSSENGTGVPTPESFEIKALTPTPLSGRLQQGEKSKRHKSKEEFSPFGPPSANAHQIGSVLGDLSWLSDLGDG